MLWLYPEGTVSHTNFIFETFLYDLTASEEEGEILEGEEGISEEEEGIQEGEEGVSEEEEVIQEGEVLEEGVEVISEGEEATLEGEGEVRAYASV